MPDDTKSKAPSSNEEIDEPADDTVPSAEELLSHIVAVAREKGGGQLVHVERYPPQQPQYATPSYPLPKALQRALDVLGISQLYTHQVESLERARRGEDVVVVTATSSGKTLCYNLPVLEALLEDRSASALYIYPTNALVNDQLKTLFKMNLTLGHEALGIAKYTGAVDTARRKRIRSRQPQIVLTNPEMVHLSFLLWHQKWEALWSNLRFIVVDEVHTYRGIFGSNMAHLFRRMLRMAKYYGSSPQFICCSATMANPQELTETLTGRPFSVVDKDGAGSGRRYFALWNPGPAGGDASNAHRSYTEETVDLLLHCLRADYNTIVFARSRRLTERMLRQSRERAGAQGHGGTLPRIASYRAGYLAQERESIENDLKTGVLRGVITTNALEMGIDIGELDAAIISGYPGTIMSTWQQAGRAGRRGRDALIFLVTSQNPLDQYYVKHPQAFFAQPHERAIVNLDNQYIRLKHLLCSIAELPMDAAELARLPGETRQIIERLQEKKLLEAQATEDGGQRVVYPRDQPTPHLEVALRSAGSEVYRILDGDHNQIGTIGPPNVYREAHPGAIYQHGGDDYRVTYLDRRHRTVSVREERALHYTRPNRTLRLRIEEVHASRPLPMDDGTATLSLGDVLVEETIYGYQELRLGSDEMVRRVNLDYPFTLRLHTTAMWLALPREIGARMPQATSPEEDGDEHDLLASGLHAVQHLLTGVMPLLVMCDRRDVDGFYDSDHQGVGPAVFVYDGYEGGIGLAEAAYRGAEDLLRLAYETVDGCPCRDGCPACIQSGTCRQRNESLSKAGAETILGALVAGAETSTETREGIAPLSPENAAFSRERALEALEAWRRKDVRAYVGHAEEKTAVTQRFQKGDRVKLSPYGGGVVLSSEVRDGQEWVTVRFFRRSLVKEIDASKGRLRKVS
ncbi:MAG: DEAD/DEAH box helicase [Chloroflexota bacterium]|nr:DEAD/DEAH box helicase [Chloroflexota bacterium]